MRFPRKKSGEAFWAPDWTIPGEDELSDEDRGFVDWLADKLPPVLARKGLAWFLGKAVSPGKMAQLDSKGQGPAGAFYLGRDVHYPTRAFLVWLVGVRKVRPLAARGVNALIAPPRRESNRGPDARI